MELVPLSDVTLRHLILDDPILKRVFHGVHPSDRLPSRPSRTTRVAYIINTDPRGELAQHWLGLWTRKGTCGQSWTTMDSSFDLRCPRLGNVVRTKGSCEV